MSNDGGINTSIIGRLLEEISWEGKRVVHLYRGGGRGKENVLTAEVMISLGREHRAADLECPCALCLPSCCPQRCRRVPRTKSTVDTRGLTPANGDSVGVLVVAVWRTACFGPNRFDQRYV